MRIEQEIISNIRNRIIEYRNSEEYKSYFPKDVIPVINYIEIANNIFEIAIIDEEPIREECRIFFGQYYHFQFVLAGSKYRDILDNYVKISDIVRGW
jgi:hypothetical protein